MSLSALDSGNLPGMEGWLFRSLGAGEEPVDALGLSGSEFIMGNFEREQHFVSKNFGQFSQG